MHYFLQLAAMSNIELVDRIFNSKSRLFGPGELENELDELRSAPDEIARDHRLVVAGIGTDGTAEQAAATLGQHGFDVPLQVVSFELLGDSTGRRLLLREVDEDGGRAAERPTSTWSFEAVMDLAAEYGVRDSFHALYEALRDRGYRSYVKKKGLNFNLGGRQQVFWIKPGPNGLIHVGYLASNFPSLFGVDETEASAELGANWLDLRPDAARVQTMKWVEQIEAMRQRSETDQEV
jgi:hypothetical protein